MKPDMTARERLTADLELLGSVADPARGPLADLYASSLPQQAPRADHPSPAGLWPRVLLMAAELSQLRHMQPAPALPHARRTASRLRWPARLADAAHPEAS